MTSAMASMRRRSASRQAPRLRRMENPAERSVTDAEAGVASAVGVEETTSFTEGHNPRRHVQTGSSAQVCLSSYSRWRIVACLTAS